MQKKLFDARDKVIVLFEKRVFSYEGNVFKTKEKKNQEKNQMKTNFLRDIENESQGINYELFEKYFKFSVPTVFTKTLTETNNKKKNFALVNVINSGLKYLKKEITNMIKEKKETEKPDKIIDFVAEILAFNTKIQSGQGLKILTSDQMLSRLLITLAQLKAGNNSEKLKNKIRQLLYSLYRSKKLTKKLYKSLINII